MKFSCGTTVPVYKDLIISTIVDGEYCSIH